MFKGLCVITVVLSLIFLMGCGTSRITIYEDEAVVVGRAHWILERDDDGKFQRVEVDNKAKPLVQLPPIRFDN